MNFLKKRKGLIIIISIVSVLIFFIARPKPQVAKMVEYQILEPKELVESISAKGVVLSEDTKNIYGTSNLQIKEIFVEVGDKVTQGQVLLKVDTYDLESSINERKSMLSKQSETSLVQLENNKRLLEEAKSNLKAGTDSSLISVESRIKTAEVNLQNAKDNYNKKIAEYENKDLSQIVNAETAISNAESALRNTEIDFNNKTTDLEKGQTLYNAGTISLDELQKLEKAKTNSENALIDAKRSVEDAKTLKGTTDESVKSEIDKLKQAVDTAQISYDEALSSKQSTEINLKQSIEKYEDSVRSSEVATKTDSDIIAIKNLEDKLERTAVTSPINGTVTAVITKEGSNAQGLLFVLEDTNNLKIKTKIKESDYGRITEGMKVKIHSDATGNDEYEGEISKIPPTSIKDATGATNITSDVEFEIEIRVLTKDTKLKIGMNAKLDIIISEKPNATYVTFDSVAINDKNEDIVYIVAKDDKGSYIAKQKTIKIIKETDFYIEIEGLEQGEKIIQDASSMEDDMKIIFNEDSVSKEGETK